MVSPGLLWLSLALVLAFGCGPSANDRYAALTVHDAPSGAYRLRYLAPPWKLLRAEGETTELIIEVGMAPFVTGDAGVPPKYDLLATVQGGTARQVIRHDTTAAVRRGETVLVPMRPVQTDDGATGYEVLTERTSPDVRHFRYVTLGSTHGVVHLTFEATPDLDEPEVDAMVGAVGVDVSP